MHLDSLPDEPIDDPNYKGLSDREWSARAES